MEKRHGMAGQPPAQTRRIRVTALPPVAGLVAAAAVVKLVIHLLTGSGYGFFYDELYTIALSRHLDFGYTDLPPLFPLLAAGSRFLFGESLLACHLMPALAGALTLVCACLIVRELGGRLFATGLTALAFLTSPWWLIADSVLCYDSLDQLVCAAFLLVFARLLRTGNRRLWIALGVTAGLAFLTKATILFLGPGFLAGVLASKLRRQLRAPEPWIGVGMFLLLAAPYVIWNDANHWPTIAYWTNYGLHRVYRYSILEYLGNIAITMGFALMPFLVAGLLRIFRPFSGASFRPFGVLFLATAAIVFVLRTRAIVLSALCIPLVAAAAVWMEEMLLAPGWMVCLRTAAVALLLGQGILVAPLSVPILPVSRLSAYAKTFGFLHQGMKDFRFSSMGHFFYLLGRIGWDDLVGAVAKVYASLPAEDRARAGIMTNLYGIAGAIDLLGRADGLPPAVCGNLEYYRWGPGTGSWDVMIVVTLNLEAWARMFFSDVSLAATVPNMLPGHLNGYNIFVCRSPLAPPQALWPSTLSY